MPVRTGLERLLSDAQGLQGLALGLIEHPASVTRDLVPSAGALQAAGFNIRALFGPQHGARGEKQDDMIESDNFRDAHRALPVYSLYGDVRKPTPEMLEGLDALVFDLQDVGVRIYTFVWTMTLAMEACRDAGIRFVVLDRPNPIGGHMRAGRVLRPGFESFVGLHPVPLRHGLTAGELARVANEAFGIACDLQVVPCDSWRRDQWFGQTGLPFVFPSPNIPTFDTCVVYPGMVLFEGTNLSEGRGTTKPFELFGAPYLSADAVVAALQRYDLPGVIFRAASFEPTFQKHVGKLCHGAQLHVTDRDAFEPVKTAVSILRVVKDLAPDGFAWREPGYEYEFEKMPIDLLWGADDLRIQLDAGTSAEEIIASTAADVRAFSDLVEPYLLYR